MKAISGLLVVAGVASFVLPLFRVHIPWLAQLGDARTFFSIVLILIGCGLFFFLAGND
jgi:hypothetical protein